MERLHKVMLGLLLVTVVLGACSPGGGEPAATPVSQDVTPATGAVTTTIETQALDSAESDGFRAQVTSAISVDLIWSPVAGASRYEIEGSVGDQEYFPVTELAPDVTSYEVFPVPDEAQLNFRLSAVGADGSRSSREVRVTTPVEVPNPYVVEVTLEQPEIAFAGFDPATFDPATFDPSTIDPSIFDAENFDPSSFLPQSAGVTQEIGPEGGRLEVTSSNGTVYTLTIPEGALPFALDITMTPIASLEGLPAEVELLGAVQIEPEGVALSAPALLTIELPEQVSESADRMLVGIGFGTGGDDFHFLPLSEDAALASASVSPAKLARPVAIGAGGATMFQTQSQGVAKASPAAVNKHTRTQPPADRSRSTRQRTATRNADRPTSSGGGDVLYPLETFESWLAENIKNRAKESGSPTGSYRDLFEALQDLEILMDEWGDEFNETGKDRIWEPMLEALHARLKEAAEASCMSDAHMYGIQLAERLSKPASDFDKEMLKRFTDKYGAEGKELIRKARQLAERCPLYLWIESEITHTDLDNFVDTTTKITAEVPLTWRFGGSQRRPYLTGTGEISYEKAEFVFDDGCLAEPDTKDGSWFVVLRLSPLFKKDGTLDNFNMERYHGKGRMQDIVVTYAPEESGCEEGPQGNKGPGGDLWWTDYGAYMMVNGGFPIKDWVVRANAGMSTIADKMIVHDGTTIDLGTLWGSTKFIILNENPQ